MNGIYREICPEEHNVDIDLVYNCQVDSIEGAGLLSIYTMKKARENKLKSQIRSYLHYAGDEIEDDPSFQMGKKSINSWKPYFMSFLTGCDNRKYDAGYISGLLESRRSLKN